MDWTQIIPAIITAILTYIIAVRRTKMKQAQDMADIQSNAIKVVAEIEERLRKEFRQDLIEIRKENDELRVQVGELKGKLSASDHLVGALKDEISVLKSTIELYKDEMARNKKRLSDLETGNGHNVDK
jgi:predicted nuclease with TOPRIM domain